MAEDNAQKDLPLDDGKPDPDVGSSQQASGAEAQARLLAAQQEAASLREKDAARKKKESDAAKKKADKEAVEKGEAAKVIDELNAKIAEQEALVAAFNRSTDKRIDAKIEKLPDAVRAEVELIRDVLPREKLESFVDLKFSGMQSMEVKKGAPAPSATRGGRSRDDDPLDQGTKEMLDSLMAPETVYEIGRQVGHFTIGAGRDEDGAVRGQAGDEKFRYMATGDDDEDTRRWIRFVKATSVDPFRAQREAQLKRIKALKDTIKS